MVKFLCTCQRDLDVESENRGNKEGIVDSVAFYDKSSWEKVANAKILPLIDPETISYESFFEEYIVKNLPCMLSKGVTSDWLSRNKWTKSIEGNDQINYEFLLDVYGDAKVSVVNCDDGEYKEGYGSSDCRDMLFSDFISYWKELSNASGVEDSGMCAVKENVENDIPSLYLKDWHIVKFHESRPAIASKLCYETPVFFQSDFLNESCSQNNSDDFKFCYMGPKGSFTSFHADVYGSYSWSANIFGVKRWYLYPPGKELIFVDPKTKRLKYDWNNPGTEGVDYIEVIQEAGECLFVPSGWHHVVWNLTDAISINHNWFNGANLTYIWNCLQKALKEVEKELNDLRDIPEFHEQCQILLKAHHGMNYSEFFELLELIVRNRQTTIASSAGSKGLSFQCKYDLDAIDHVIKLHCQNDPDVMHGRYLESFPL